MVVDPGVGSSRHDDTRARRKTISGAVRANRPFRPGYGHPGTRRSISPEPRVWLPVVAQPGEQAAAAEPPASPGVAVPERAAPGFPAAQQVYSPDPGAGRSLPDAGSALVLSAALDAEAQRLLPACWASSRLPAAQERSPASVWVSRSPLEDAEPPVPGSPSRAALLPDSHRSCAEPASWDPVSALPLPEACAWAASGPNSCPAVWARCAARRLARAGSCPCCRHPNAAQVSWGQQTESLAAHSLRHSSVGQSRFASAAPSCHPTDVPDAPPALAVSWRRELAWAGPAFSSCAARPAAK